MNLPPLTHKPKRAHNYIDREEYHSLYEWAANPEDEDA